MKKERVKMLSEEEQLRKIDKATDNALIEIEAEREDKPRDYIAGKTDRVNKWERKLIRKYKPINNYLELSRDGKWFRENGYLVCYDNGKIASQPIFPKVNSTHKDPKYNKSFYYRREHSSTNVYKIIKSKNDRLWIEMEYCNKSIMIEFIKQSNGSYKMKKEKI
jgi:hypothetical protein